MNSSAWLIIGASGHTYAHRYVLRKENTSSLQAHTSGRGEGVDRKLVILVVDEEICVEGSHSFPNLAATDGADDQFV